MRVLDVGSGAGDVAFLAADLVGPTGQVVGVDRSAAAPARARIRAEGRSLANVTFRESELSAMTFDQPFDAAIGRYVLCFQPDPVYYLVYRRRSVTCAEGEVCARALPRRGVKLALWAATALIASAMAFPYVARALLGT
jgi:ubiquinone/menaquinone biosynthesis C-methylase UbiE